MKYFVIIALLILATEYKLTAESKEMPLTTQPLDYSQNKCWAAKPKIVKFPADVFYIFPTIYAEKSPLNMDIMNRKDLQDKAKGLTISQASVYSSSANLFAPYYRQVSFKALNPNENMYENKFFKIAADDARSAFEYYLKHLNNGRPFILASHSQGTLVVIDILRNMFHSQSLQKKLIAAYLIGYSIMPEDFKKYTWIKPAKCANDTGVVIAYNTQTPSAKNSPVLKKGAYCINPLNWKTDETPAGKNENLGAVFFNDYKGTLIQEIPHYTGAKINTETGALETLPDGHEKLSIGAFPPGVLHKYDYSFWYRNLEANAALRIKTYLSQNKRN